MNRVQQNFTIIVNWKKKGFGCAKVCSYCNWRDSALLPHGAQSANAISTFIKQCRKSFITISGGADPLYRFEEYRDDLLAMIATVRQHGFKVRLITREVQHISKLRGLVDFISVSLDAEVLQAIKQHQDAWEDLEIEYSLVLPPLPTSEIAALKSQYATLRGMLGRRLILRENLNSIFPLDIETLSFGHSGIVFVPKKLCLDSRYLATVDCTGHDIVQDNEALARYLMQHPDVVLFGGFVKHLLNPARHMEYGDIDMVAFDAGTVDALSARYAYSFKTLSPADSYPRYFVGKPSKAGKPIHLVLMHSKADALRFIHNAQYDIDRVGYGDNQFYFDPSIGEEAIRRAIDTKQVTAVDGPRDMGLFHTDRTQIEQRHKIKLVRKGFAITESPISPIHI